MKFAAINKMTGARKEFTARKTPRTITTAAAEAYGSECICWASSPADFSCCFPYYEVHMANGETLLVIEVQ